jgi:1,5-anhydro-D-fructose reductase (1,5-anhydro-D-mannitol-forming)
MIRWGILGCGGVAEAFIAPGIAEADNSVLHSVFSRDAAKADDFRKRHGAAKSFNNLDAFLSDGGVDTVFVATANGQHSAHVRACAAAGKHVLCEKPLALSLKEGERMISSCQRAGVKLGVGYQLRFHPLHQEMFRRIRAGELGRIASTRAHFFFRLPGPPAEWRRRKQTAGGWVTNDLGTHLLDLLLELAGDVTEVAARFSNSRFGFETEELAVITLQFESGAVGVIECSIDAYAPASRLEVYGLDGFLIAEGTIGKNVEGTLLTGDHNQQEQVVAPATNLYAAEISAFSRAIEEDTEPPVPGTAGLRAVAVMESAYQAAREGRFVPVYSKAGAVGQDKDATINN